MNVEKKEEKNNYSKAKKIDIIYTCMPIHMFERVTKRAFIFFTLKDSSGLFPPSELSKE